MEASEPSAYTSTASLQFRNPSTPNRAFGGYKGVDELAKRLTMKPAPKDGGRLLIAGESGTLYDIPEMCQRMLDVVDSTFAEPTK